MKTPCSPVHFFVDVCVAGIVPSKLLIADLQRAFDDGAEGVFDVSYTADTTTVRFERTVADADGDYLRKRVEGQGSSVAHAAQLQLADELATSVQGPAQPFVAQLRLLAGVIRDPHDALDLVYDLAGA